MYPVVFSDGEHFDERARETQYRRDISEFTYPYPCFRDSVLYLDFHRAVTSIAQEICEHLTEIPDWQPDWPIIIPEEIPTNPVNLAGL